MMNTSIILSLLGLTVLACSTCLALLSYYKSQPQHPQQIHQTMRRCDWLLILALTAIYFGASLYNLASFNQGQGNWIAFTPGKKLTLVFNQPTRVEKIAYYLGIANGSFKLTATTTTGQNIQLSQINTATNPPPLFTWSNTSLTPPLKVKSITLVATKPFLQLKQLAIIGNNNQYLTNFKIMATQLNNQDDIAHLIRPQLPPYWYFSWRSSIIFDELYYAITAYQFLHDQYPYVDAHPPLAMLTISLGIKLLGMNPVGWRLPGLICGSLMLIIIYVFAKQLLHSRRAAIVASVLLSCDCMHFTISRLGIIESEVTLWILAEYWMLYNFVIARQHYTFRAATKYLLGCGLCLGLGIASKWSAFYSIPVILASLSYTELILNRQTWRQLLTNASWIILAILILPVAIYGLSYIPYLAPLQPSNYFTMLAQLQAKMFHFHTQVALSFHNGHESSWWSWPLLLQPYSIYFQLNPTTGLAQSLVLIGNPAIWWYSLVAVLLLFLRLSQKLELNRIFLLAAWGAQYLPYALLQRASYIYYFYTVLPYAILIITATLERGLARPELSLKVLVWGYLIIVISCFIAFYPAVAGLMLPRIYVYKYLMWFHSWLF